MHRPHFPFVLIAAALCWLLPGGCSNTQMLSSWEDPQFNKGPFRKVLVMALGKRMDVRQRYEDAFVRQLQKRGVAAVPGYTLIPYETDRLDREALNKAIADSGAEAVIITRVLRVERRVVEPPGTVTPPAPGLHGFYADSWTGYYEPPIPAGFQAGPQVYEETVATVETNLFDARTSEIVWYATTETFEADQWQRQIPGLVRTLVSAMARARLV